MDIQELLRKVKNDEIDLESAADQLKKLPYEDLGFAKLDHHRKLRSGFGEVVYCSMYRWNHRYSSGRRSSPNGRILWG
ncbi:hypothetical protein SAMN05446037_101912 [Anaerovirgula multivorans]|uniref:1-(5-phosphoribosyl)-5-amino-4-imidazole-carboxylate carboxylase n=1 Tax=Anaerovirgula multivorans TaxID=312168 RepID=A0A239GXG0_9FIRM|nr:hypothetical protein [Anaerovirgula multivorans]SNS73631.1 hypothetical protein SAMN05446037_101912 [Anaerovirgula multivorans]